ncbi:hypothetical protein Zmor_023353 [Zophobas morio]|uniref:Reverse transcriptase domain-containing protein n=1 Tax=Zophobas morio TaxID=2755281 RepID=A0AA38M799_9CUCU|nr:hypothetical protein Zmor_023353 [Zophobas morio]
MAITAEQIELLIQRLKPETPAKQFTQCTSRFDGTRKRETVEEFIADVEYYRTSEKVSEENAIKGLRFLLQGDAYTWWCGISSLIRTWDEAIAALRNEFAPRLLPYQVYQEVFATAQDANTPTSHFISKKRALLAQIDPPDSETKQMDFIYGLLKIEIRDRVPRRTVATFTELITAARQVEATLQEVRKQKTDEEGAKQKKTKCEFCHNYGHDVTVCRKKHQQGLRREAPRVPAHLEIPNNRTSTKSISCYGCGQPGVIRRKCSNCCKKPTIATASFDFCFLDTQASIRPAVPITIQGAQGTAYLDSGAKTSLASAQLTTLLKQRGYPFSEKTVLLTQADGKTENRQVLVTTIPVTLMGRTIDTTFVSLPDARDSRTLLGIDFHKSAGLVIDYEAQRWHFKGSRHETYGFVSKDDDALPANGSTAALDIRAANTPTLEELTTMLEEHHLPRPLTPIPDVTMECDVISGIADSYGPCITNDFSRTGFMMQDAANAVQQEWDRNLEGPYARLWRASMDIQDVTLRTDEGTKLSEAQVRGLNELLCQNMDLFSAHGPPTPFAEHRINTNNHPPISSPPYRQNPVRLNLLRAEVSELLEQGIIEECESPWAAPTVLVPKSSGGYRLCIDYRRLNDVTVADTYPLPRLDDLLHSTGKAKYLSTMDLKSGYYQIQVAKEDRDKTAIVTPFGLYRFLRLPFGLRNAPAAF